MADSIGDFTDIVGGNGLFQKSIFFYFFLCSAPHCLHNLIMTFFAPDVDHWCARPYQVLEANISTSEWKNTSLPLVRSRTGNMELSHCTMFQTDIRNGSLYVDRDADPVKCSSWEYDHSFYKYTMVDQWNLVCEREWLISLSKTVYMAAFLISATMCGQMSDRFGRRTVVIVCLIIFLAAGFLSLLSTNYIMFVVLRFFVAMGLTSVYTVSYVILTEVVSVEYRSVYLFTFKFGWVFAYMLMPYIAWLVPDWFWLQLAFTLPWVILLSIFWVVPETPRWLLIQGKTKELENVLMYAARLNNKDLKQSKIAIQRYLSHIPPQKKLEEKKRETVIDLLKTPFLRKCTLNMYFCWFIISYIYYALSWNTNDMGGDPYWTFFAAGAVELPAGILFIFICKYTGHRIGLLIANIAAGLCLIATIFVTQDLVWLSITFSMAGKFFNSASFDMVYIYTAELFPTVVRNVAVGSSSTFARVGALVAPFIRQVADVTHPVVPQLVPGVLSALSGLLMLLLPETKGRKIPDTLEEGELFAKKGKRTAYLEKQNGYSNGLELGER